MPKTAAFIIALPELQSSMRNILLLPYIQILPHMQCKCDEKKVVNVRDVNLQKCKIHAIETKKPHD